MGMVAVLGVVISAQTPPVAQGPAADYRQLPSLGVLGTPLPSPPPQGGMENSSISQGGRNISARGARDLNQIKAMLYQAALRHGVNAGLVMGVAWWESGWDQSQVSSTGAIGIMQVEPYTAASAGPRLLHQNVDIKQAESNIELGAAILRENLERYHGSLVDALVAYYAGPDAVTDWAHLPPDAQRYVTGIYALAVAFDRGQGPA